MKNKNYFLIFFIFYYIIPAKIRTILKNSLSEINLIVRGNGNIDFLYSSYSITPSEVLVNGIKDDSCERTCNLIEDINNITIRFEEQIESCYKMFYELKKIIEVDLSNFDFSKVNDISYMFYSCSNLEKVNFSNLNTFSLTKMSYLFNYCSKLISIDLSDFDFSKVSSLKAMFFDCSNLEKIYFGNINTSSVIDMSELFRGCNKLISMDLSNFDFSKVINMGFMFYGCSNLETIHFGNINTSSVESISFLFTYCSSLISLDLSKFDSSKIQSMKWTFAGCTNLKYLDLSNFDILKVNTITSLFLNCESLIYLKLNSLELNRSLENTKLFDGFSNKTKYCIENESLKNYLLSKTGIVPNCSDECFNKDIKIDINNNSCIKSCLDNGYEYEYNNICYNKCPKGTLMNNNSCEYNLCNQYNQDLIECLNKTPEGYYFDYKEEIYKKCYEKCKFCYGEGNETNHNCIKCNNNFLLLDDEFVNSTHCYEKCKYYYYIDELNNYHCTEKYSCPEEYNKIIQGKNKCIDDCKKDNIYKCEYNNLCYINCPSLETYNELIEEFLDNEEYNKEEINEYENIIDDINEEENTEGEYLEVENVENEFIKENISFEVSVFGEGNDYKKYECIDNDEFITKCFMKDINNGTEIYDIIKNYILPSYSHDSQKNHIFEIDNIIYQLTNEKNELDLLKGNNSNNYNLSIIDLAECNALLKRDNNILENDSLIYLKQENLGSKASEKNVIYEVFEPYNKTKLNSSICSGISFNLYVKFDLSDELQILSQQIKESGYNMFDINDKFYQDICTPFKSSWDTDILLSDRIDYIYNNEDAQCQTKCKFSGYFLDSQFIKCNCSNNNQNEESNNKKDKFNSKKIYESFLDVLKYSNYNILKCPKLVFNKMVLIENKGSIIIIGFFSINLCCLIFFIIKGIVPLKLKLLKNMKNNGNNKSEIGQYNSKKNELEFQAIILNKSYPPKKKGIVRFKLENNNNIKNKNKMEEKNRKENFKNKIRLKTYYKNSNSKNSSEKENANFLPFRFLTFNELNRNEKSDKKELKKDLDKSISEENKLKYKRNLDDFELNELEYDEAAKLDKRTFLQIYFSLIKREHIIIFTFLVYDDYNLIYIKISRFIFLIVSDMAMNVFFFQDESMHKLFLNYGKYDFIQQIPQIIYSTLISQLLEVFLCFLSLTDKHISNKKTQ